MQAADSVGGRRQVGRRAAARGKTEGGSSTGGAAGAGLPQNQNSIMKFYSDEGAGLKVGPVTVLVSYS